VYNFPPTTRQDPEGAKAFSYVSESTGKKYYISCWYGLNGELGDNNKWPFKRVPSPDGQTRLNSITRTLPNMPVVYDGFWVHNGKDERINARHRKRTQTNLAFFDNSARTVTTTAIPSVQDKNDGDIRWRF
jgi:hypothetical protein